MCVVGIMDKPRTDFKKEYIHISDLLLYFAFTQQEKISDIASWLLYNSFSENVISYNLDRHYRAWVGKQKHGFDRNIERYFEQITLDGYYSYHEFLNYLQDKEDETFEAECSEYDLDKGYYKLVSSSFYLDILEVNQLACIQELGIDFRKADDYRYTIYLCDSVEAKLKNKTDLFTISDTFSGKTLKETKEAREYAKLNPKKKEDKGPFKIMSEESFKKLIEWAVSSAELQSKESAIHKTVIDKKEYDRLTPIQKYTLQIKSIVLPLAEKIWQFDKETNLLMRRQTAKLIVELLSDFSLTINQVDEWLKQSELVPRAIIDRCARHDYGNTKPEKIEREALEQKIRQNIAPDLQILLASSNQF